MSFKSAVFLGSLLTCVIVLHSAPDPDLFDGRVLVTLPASEVPDSKRTDGQKSDAAAEDASDASGSERDLNQIGSIESEEPVSAENSKSGESGTGAKEEDGTTASSKQDAKQSEGTSSSDKSGNSSSESKRSFEDFEIGAVNDANSAIEVNVSKDTRESSSPASKSSVEMTHSSTQDADKNNTASQEQSGASSGLPDYGSTVPSGL